MFIQWKLGLRLRVYLLALLGAVACSGTTAPTTVFGTYPLTGYTLGAGDLALPYVQEIGGVPGDTDRWVGGTLTLMSDSTWVNVWAHVICDSGVCGAEQPDTVHGVFHLLLPGDSTATTLQMLAWPTYDPSQAAVIRGNRLELYNMWLYQR